MERTIRETLEDAFLSLLVCCGVLVALSTEVLSSFGALRRPFVAAVWLGGAGMLAAFVVRSRARWRERTGWDRTPSDGLLPEYLAVAGILLVTGVVAIVSPANNFDSMSYHMPRVMHWIQAGSVEHYSTPIVAQIANAPWAEYAIAHLQLLWGGDRLANLVQWVSFAGCAAGAASIARRLGGSREAGALGALFVVTLPMAILQASSTQTDLAASLWAVLFVSNALAYVQEGRGRFALQAGASLGLGLLTKTTLYPFLAPFVIWMGVLVLRSKRRPGPVVLAVLVVLLLNGCTVWRSTAHFGWPFGPKAWSEYHGNNGLTLGGLASNVLRNVALHLELKGDRIRPWVERKIVALHGAMGVDPDDGRFTTWGSRFSMPPPWNHEDFVGNTAHLVLLAPVLGWILLGSGLPREKLYSLSLVAGFLLFCAILKWQPWNSRYHLPLFVLGAPLAAVWLEKRCRRSLRMALSIVLVGLSAAPLLANATRPLLPRKGNVFTTDRLGLLFANRPDERGHYEAIAASVRERRSGSVGLVVSVGDWEYPFWVLLGSEGSCSRIEHVCIRAPGSVSASRTGSPDTLFPEVDEAFQPDAIVQDVSCLEKPAEELLSFPYRRGVYRLVQKAGSLRLFVPVWGLSRPE